MPRLPLTEVDIAALDARKCEENLDHARLQYERKIRADLESVKPFLKELLKEWTELLSQDIRFHGNQSERVRNRLRLGTRLVDVISYLDGRGPRTGQDL